MSPRALLLLAAVSTAAACTGGLGHRSTDKMTGSLPIGPEVRSVLIEIEDGSLEIRPADDGVSDLVYEGQIRRGADIAEDLALLEQVPVGLLAEVDSEDPTLLRVRGPSRPAQLKRRCVLGVELVVRLPARLALVATVNGSGHLTVEDREAAVELRTGRGDLRATGCVGSAELTTGTGMTIVYDHRGDLRVTARVGDMQVVMRECGERLRLVTGQGNVQCRVPPNTGFRLDARAEKGKLTNGFGIPVERNGYSAAMVGDRGDQRTEAVLRTSSGSLSFSYKNWDE